MLDTETYEALFQLNKDLLYIPDFLNADEFDWSEYLHSNAIAWQQGTVKIFGKEILEPRLTAWYAEKPYVYSGRLLKPVPYPEQLKFLKERVEQKLQVSFNSLLLNRYRQGEDYMGWHSDDEKELGAQPNIACITVGTPRKFVFRSKRNHKIKRELWLENGSLLLMKGDTQRNWQHTLPKTKKVKSERISLTFRYIY